MYLDYNATTPVDPRVIEVMIPVFSKQFGNPSSTTHDSGLVAMNMVDTAREQVAAIIGRGSHDVIFTSGATEANNMVMFGLSRDLDYNRHHNRVILISAIEHKSVLETCRHLETMGIKIMVVPVTSDGVIELAKLADMMDKNVDLVSIMAANSETGVIQPIDKVSKIVHDHGSLLHCDATQAIGKIPFNADDLGVDIVTMSSHKVYGPKGCGAVIATREARRRLAPLICGGGQENNLRSGTLNVPGIVGFGKACEIAAGEGLADAPRQESLRDLFEKNMMSSVDGVTVNGHNADRLPNTSNIRIAGAIADAVIVNARSIEVSAGSACSSAAMEPSHVLMAMGLDRTAADESLRVSFGRPTTRQDVELAASEISNAVEFVRGREAEALRRMV